MYLTELGKYGYEDGPRSRLDITNRIQSMYAVQKAWETPNPKILFKTTLQFPETGRPRNTGWSIDSHVLVRSTGIIALNGGDAEHTRLDIVDLLSIGSTAPEINTIYLKFQSSEVYVDLNLRLMFVIENADDLMG